MVRPILSCMSNNTTSISWEMYFPLWLIHLKPHQDIYYVQLCELQKSKMWRSLSKSKGSPQGGPEAGTHHEQCAWFIQCSAENSSEET